MASTTMNDGTTSRGVTPRLVVLLVLCAPSVLGTIALSALTILGGLGASPAAGTIASVFGASAAVLFMMGAYGPLLLVGAVPLAFGVTRRTGVRSRLATTSWVAIAMVLIATVVFYSWLTFAAELP